VNGIIYYYQQGMINDIRWLDRWETPGVETLPFEKRDIKHFTDIDNADYGAILLSILEAEHFRRNQNIKPLRLRVNSRTGIIEKEGLILAGFPWEYSQIITKAGPPGKEMVSFSSELICLPIREKTWEEISVHDGNWNDEAAFYGEIVPYIDILGGQPGELKGMSGGPIFSISREQDIVNIELEAIFDSYIKRSREIRAEPTSRVFLRLESWLSDLQ
jgi:hypothetical protein